MRTLTGGTAIVTGSTSALAGAGADFVLNGFGAPADIEKERAAIVLRDLEGLPTPEVARVLGSSEATVRSQISKGRVKMRGFVERYFGRRP